MTYNLNSALLNLNETQSSVFLDYPLILYKIERTNVKKKQRLYFHFYYFSEKNDLKSIKLISYSNDINLEISNIFNTYNSSIYVGVVEDELEKLNKINDFVIYSFTNSKGTYTSEDFKVINYKLSLVQEYYFEKYNKIVFDTAVVPNINNVFWQCTCGFINSNTKNNCGYCKTNIYTLNSIPLKDSNDFIFRVVAQSNPIEFNYNLSFEENIKGLISKLKENQFEINDINICEPYLELKDKFEDSKNYLLFKKSMGNYDFNPRIPFIKNLELIYSIYVEKGISIEKLKTWIDIDDLNKKYTINLKNYRTFIKDISENLNPKISFGDNIKLITNKYLNNGMSKERFDLWFDFADLKLIYEQEYKSYIAFIKELDFYKFDPKFSFEENMRFISSKYLNKGMSREKFDLWVNLIHLKSKYDEDYKKYISFKKDLNYYNFDPRISFEENMELVSNYFLQREISEEKFYLWINLNELKSKYDEDCKKYLSFKNELDNYELDPRVSFQENIQHLIKYLSKRKIAEEKINEWIDLGYLNTKYDVEVNEMKKRQATTYRYIFVGIAIAIIIVLLSSLN